MVVVSGDGRIDERYRRWKEKGDRNAERLAPIAAYDGINVEQLKRRLAVQRGAIVSLEQEVKRLMGFRRAVVDIQQHLVNGETREARLLLSEVLLRWPST